MAGRCGASRGGGIFPSRGAPVGGVAWATLRTRARDLLLQRPAPRSPRAGPTLGFALLLCTWAVPPLAAQAPVTRDSVTLVPGPQFSTTSWIRWLATPLFGARYRHLWNTPITVPLLDPAATGGGLRPTGSGTGHDAGLYFFVGADGSHWTFWPLDRTDPRSMSAGIVPKSVSTGLIEDLTSGRNPAGPLVAAALAQAAGVPNREAWLLALPAHTIRDDSSANAVPRAGYLLRADPVASADTSAPLRPGAVLTSLAMLHRRLTDPSVVLDEAAVLQQALFSVYVGDFNPRFMDWRWEAVPAGGTMLLRPLGAFREAALARYDGVVTYLSRPLQPDLTTFRAHYPHILTGIPDQASAYRFLLGGLPRSTWDSTAQLIQERLTDSVIAAAVGRMPAAYQQRDGERLVQILRERRDNFPQAVDRMFRSVRRQATVYGTTGSEAVSVEWPSPDSLRLLVGTHAREYAGDETKRVTVFLSGGTDTVRFLGERGRAPSLRLVPLPGVGELIVEGNADGSPAVLYGKGADGLLSPSGALPVKETSIDDALALLDSTGAQRTDGNKNYTPTFWLSLSSGVGWLIGGGVVRTDWSGDARPYRNRVKLRAGYGSDSKNGIVQLLGDFRWEDSPLRLNVEMVASGVGATYFYGFGNDTPGDSANSYYRAGRTVLGFAPTLVLPLSPRVRVGAGLELKSVDTPTPDTLFIGVDQPYGVSHFGEGGLTGDLIFDSRDVTGAPRSGGLASVNAGWFPLTDGSGSGFGTVTGSIAGYWTPPWWQAMTVAGRVSGTHTWGDVPYFEAAFIGGGRTVRGLPQGRFEGNQSAFGNLDLRFRVSRVQFVLPWDFGVLGLADLGRVWVTGEHSNTWHPSFGGGLWVALLDRSLAASLNVATGAGQGVFVNAGGGFSF